MPCGGQSSSLAPKRVRGGEVDTKVQLFQRDSVHWGHHGEYAEGYSQQF